MGYLTNRIAFFVRKYPTLVVILMVCVLALYFLQVYDTTGSYIVINVDNEIIGTDMMEYEGTFDYEYYNPPTLDNVDASAVEASAVESTFETAV